MELQLPSGNLEALKDTVASDFVSHAVHKKPGPAFGQHMTFKMCFEEITDFPTGLSAMGGSVKASWIRNTWDQVSTVSKYHLLREICTSQSAGRSHRTGWLSTRSGCPAWSGPPRTGEIHPGSGTSPQELPPNVDQQRVHDLL